MISRMGMAAVPLWQIALSVILLVLTIWGMLWFSSRLYRVGIFMYGKRATLPETACCWLRAIVAGALEMHPLAPLTPLPLPLESKE